MKNGEKNVFTQEENREYLWKLFSMAKKVENAMTAHKAGIYENTRLNATDIRAISEILYAKGEGRKLISTQIASRLGVTRSAVSQIVNKLEKARIFRRVPDAVDRKIAYVDFTEEAEERLAELVNEYGEFVGAVVAKFGESRFEELLTLVNEFSIAVNTVKK